MLLAGDIGGTKTLLGLFSRAPERPVAIEVGEFATLDYESLVPMIREFLKGRGVEARRIAAATFGVAGAITEQVARLTNVPWLVDAALVAEAATLRRVHLLNDLEAMATAVPDATVKISGDPMPAGRSTQTDANGGYAFQLLLPGKYTIEVEKPGIGKSN